MSLLPRQRLALAAAVLALPAPGQAGEIELKGCGPLRGVARSAVVDDFASEAGERLPAQRPGRDTRRCKTILPGVVDRDDCQVLMSKPPFLWTVSWELEPQADARAEADSLAGQILGCLPGSARDPGSAPGHITIFWPVGEARARIKIDARTKSPQIDLWISKPLAP